VVHEPASSFGSEEFLHPTPDRFTDDHFTGFALAQL
jgi:hypothetical protein